MPQVILIPTGKLEHAALGLALERLFPGHIRYATARTTPGQFHFGERHAGSRWGSDAARP